MGGLLFKVLRFKFYNLFNEEETSIERERERIIIPRIDWKVSPPLLFFPSKSNLRNARDFYLLAFIALWSLSRKQINLCSVSRLCVPFVSGNRRGKIIPGREVKTSHLVEMEGVEIDTISFVMCKRSIFIYLSMVRVNVFFCSQK